MPFATSIPSFLRLLGAPGVGVQVLAQNGNSVITVPPVGVKFWPGNPRAGFIRIKQNTLGTNGTTKIGAIQATDGINVANVYSGDASASSNNQYIDQFLIFMYDWPVANFNVNIVTGNASSTYDIEVAGVR